MIGLTEAAAFAEETVGFETEEPREGPISTKLFGEGGLGFCETDRDAMYSANSFGEVCALLSTRPNLLSAVFELVNGPPFSTLEGPTVSDDLSVGARAGEGAGFATPKDEFDRLKSSSNDANEGKALFDLGGGAGAGEGVDGFESWDIEFIGRDSGLWGFAGTRSSNRTPDGRDVSSGRGAAGPVVAAKEEEPVADFSGKAVDEFDDFDAPPVADFMIFDETGRAKESPNPPVELAGASEDDFSFHDAKEAVLPIPWFSSLEAKLVSHPRFATLPSTPSLPTLASPVLSNLGELSAIGAACD